MRNSAAVETIKGISILKLFSGERLIDRHVENMDDSDIGPARLLMLRRRQVAEARKRIIVAALLSMFNETTCSLVALTIFGVHSYLGNSLTFDQAFPALLYISILKTAVNPILGQIRSLAQAKRSLQQLSFFCTPKHMPELTETVTSPKQRTRASFAKRGATLDAPPEVRITNGSFDWGSNETGGRDRVLRGINVVFPAGKLTAVIGKVGCGKSSLLAALLGEMNADPATVVQLGYAVALSTQEPWMRNATVRDNILFSCPMDSARYADVLRVCGLDADIKSLPAGDMSVCGAKSSDLTLSQKQKISVARAVYCGADVYMFDEPFASLTATESSQLFTSCFLEHLAGRTRILATNRLDLLDQVDHIVCMTDSGGILCCGSHADISSKHPELFSSMAKKRHSISHSDAALLTFAVAPSSVAPSGKSSFADVAPLSSSAEDEAAKYSTIELLKLYAGAIGRRRAFVSGLLVALSQICRVLSYLWIAYWVQAIQADDSAQAEFNHYITVFGYLIAACSSLMLLRDAMLFVSESKASSHMHLRTLRSLMRAPLSFFATTPANGIISHLTVGQDAIDATLPRTLNITAIGLTAVSCALIVVASVAWPFALVPVFIAYFYFKSSRSYRPLSRELKRLQAAVEPRIYSLLSEAYAGARVIRAFGLVDSFHTEIENTIDAFNRIALPSISAIRWLGVRMELCANLIVTFSCIAAVFAPQYHPGYQPAYAAIIGFALSEAFGVKDTLLHSVRHCLFGCHCLSSAVCRWVIGVNWKGR
jgi:ABC-type multidrug transport system fused ATPase/permease subunit